MKHIYREGNKDTTLLLLHGTGGTEEDLLPLAEQIDTNANILSVRGNIEENGMPRYFKRLREGVFDEEDLIFRTNELHDFINQSAEEYGFDRSNVIAIGYSNGANIAASLLFHFDHPLQGAILHHPMVPRRETELPDAKGINVFIAAGKQDPICSPEESEELQTLLSQAGAETTLHWESGGHQLTIEEVKAAAAWYQQVFP